MAFHPLGHAPHHELPVDEKPVFAGVEVDHVDVVLGHPGHFTAASLKGRRFVGGLPGLVRTNLVSHSLQMQTVVTKQKT